MSRLVHWLALVSALLAAACSSRLAEPPRVAQPVKAYKPVPYPPPAAFVELVPPKPNDAAVWVDGCWVWQGTYYVWRRGGWLNAPPGARYARWQVAYTDEGALYFADGAWFDAKGQRMEPPPLLVTATIPPNEVTTEFESAR